MIGLVHCCGYFREFSCRFGVVCVMFSIAKNVTSLWDAGLVGDIFVICLFCWFFSHILFSESHFMLQKSNLNAAS